MPRRKAAPGALMEMASPEILAKMQAPETPRPRRQNRTLLRRMREQEIAKKTSTSEDPFAESRAPVHAGKYRVGELDDFAKMEPLPPTGKCSCGTRPVTWTSKNHPEISHFCSHVAHGGNGRFWTYVISELGETKRRGRPRKLAESA